jgi:hypothetical protein
MALQRAVYRPRDAAHTVLHQVIAEHLEAFLRAVAEAGDGAGLPQFVEREFREFLTCGVFEHGVARFRCEGCAREGWSTSFVAGCLDRNGKFAGRLSGHAPRAAQGCSLRGEWLLDGWVLGVVYGRRAGS